MKNVKVIFNDIDYELVTKACQQYDKLVKDYHEKDSLFVLFTLITIPSGFLIFAFAECISNASFANRIIMACTIILFALFLGQTLAYKKKINIAHQYKVNCFNIKHSLENFMRHSVKIQFDTSKRNELFYKIMDPENAYEDDVLCKVSVANEIPDTNNIVSKLKETVDKHGFVSYVWQAESEGC
jgi:hypothetical protein